jgi:hypothetical protein
MRLRYAGHCQSCGQDLPAGSTAVWDRAARTVTCLSCEEAAPTPVAPEFGTAGASARREYERRHDKRETRIRTEHPRLGGVILALTEDPQTTQAWAKGARGERLLGEQLEKLVASGIPILHDRRVPGTKANIDHIGVGAGGVVIVDAKRYTGAPALKIEGGLFSPRVERLMVGRRDCTKLVEGMKWQIEVVSAVLAQNGLGEVPVAGALCFVGADWPLIGGAFEIDGVHVFWPQKAGALLRRPGSIDSDTAQSIARLLAAELPAA